MRTSLLILAVFLLSLNRSFSGEEPLKLLFAGSSSMYWNDLPREVAKLVEGRISNALGRRVIPQAVGRSGSDIRVYWAPYFNDYEYGVEPGQSFLEKIHSDRPDIVAMMTVCAFIMDEKPSPTHAAAVTTYCTAIRDAGGEPMFYEMGWGKNENVKLGRERILDLAIKSKIRRFAPCSSAWARVYQERPDILLQHPKDNSHPGDYGHFINLACLYAALTRTDPHAQIPRTYHVWPHGIAKPTTEEEKKAESERLAAFIPDSYQARMAKWMYRPMSFQQTATIDEDTAAYLEKVAWETWQQIDQRLNETLK